MIQRPESGEVLAEIGTRGPLLAFHPNLQRMFGRALAAGEVVSLDGVRAVDWKVDGLEPVERSTPAAVAALERLRTAARQAEGVAVELSTILKRAGTAADTVRLPGTLIVRLGGIARDTNFTVEEAKHFRDLADAASRAVLRGCERGKLHLRDGEVILSGWAFLPPKSPLPPVVTLRLRERGEEVEFEWRVLVEAYEVELHSVDRGRAAVAGTRVAVAIGQHDGQWRFPARLFAPGTGFVAVARGPGGEGTSAEVRLPVRPDEGGPPPPPSTPPPPLPPPLPTAPRVSLALGAVAAGGGPARLGFEWSIEGEATEVELIRVDPAARPFAGTLTKVTDVRRGRWEVSSSDAPPGSRWKARAQGPGGEVFSPMVSIPEPERPPVDPAAQLSLAARPFASEFEFTWRTQGSIRAIRLIRLDVERRDVEGRSSMVGVDPGIGTWRLARAAAPVGSRFVAIATTETGIEIESNEVAVEEGCFPQLPSLSGCLRWLLWLLLLLLLLMLLSWILRGCGLTGLSWWSGFGSGGGGVVVDGTAPGGNPGGKPGGAVAPDSESGSRPDSGDPPNDTTAPELPRPEGVRPVVPIPPPDQPIRPNPDDTQAPWLFVDEQPGWPPLPVPPPSTGGEDGEDADRDGGAAPDVPPPPPPAPLEPGRTFLDPWELHLSDMRRQRYLLETPTEFRTKFEGRTIWNFIELVEAAKQSQTLQLDVDWASVAEAGIREDRPFDFGSIDLLNEASALTWAVQRINKSLSPDVRLRVGVFGDRWVIGSDRFAEDSFLARIDPVVRDGTGTEPLVFRAAVSASDDSVIPSFVRSLREDRRGPSPLRWGTVDDGVYLDLLSTRDGMQVEFEIACESDADGGYIRKKTERITLPRRAMVYRWQPDIDWDKEGSLKRVARSRPSAILRATVRIDGERRPTSVTDEIQVFAANDCLLVSGGAYVIETFSAFVDEDNPFIAGEFKRELGAVADRMGIGRELAGHQNISAKAWGEVGRELLLVWSTMRQYRLAYQSDAVLTARGDLATQSVNPFGRVMVRSGGGNCVDLSLAMASILVKFGYRVNLACPPEHMLIEVATDDPREVIPIETALIGGPVPEIDDFDHPLLSRLESSLPEEVRNGVDWRLLRHAIATRLRAPQSDIRRVSIEDCRMYFHPLEFPDGTGGGGR